MSVTVKVIEIPLADISESPLNHRKHFTKLDELAQSIREKGVLQPALVRPLPSGNYELVYGHRRFRASQLAERPTLPCLVRQLDDRQVIEAQVIENVGREDVHPLEEAEGYEQLQNTHSIAVEEIAAKVGKSPSYVYQRLKLTALVPKARELFYEGKLSTSTAFLVARIANEKLQEEAAIAVSTPRHGDEPMGLRQAQNYIQQNYMLVLKDAPFSTKDAELVPAAGACVACPKRTGAQPQLFEDVAKDHCTDPACWRGKVDALFQIKVVKAKAAGAEVLTGKKAEGIFDGWGDPPGLRYDAEYVDVDRPLYDYENKSLRTLLGWGRGTFAPIVAQDPNGNLRELVRRGEVKALLKKAGIAKGEQDSAGRAVDPKEKERRKKEKAKQELQVEARKRALPLIVTGARKADPGELLRFLVAESVDRRHYVPPVFLEALGFEDLDAIADKLANANIQQVKEVLVGLALSDGGLVPAAGGQETWERAAQLAGINLRDFEEAPKEEPAPKGDTKKKPSAKATKKKAGA